MEHSGEIAELEKDLAELKDMLNGAKRENVKQILKKEI